MNRGRRTENIFSDRLDYKAFVELLQETSEVWNVRIAAYCSMPSHYHMLIQTPEANISRAMRYVNGVYTQRFNSRHHCDGHLFRGRYKSILVNGDSYLFQLVRYIHRSPIKAGLIENNEMPQVKELCTDSDRIIFNVCSYYGVEHKDLFISKRGEFNEPRNVAIYLMRKLRRDSLRDIGKFFQMEKYSSVSSVIVRMKSQIRRL